MNRIHETNTPGFCVPLNTPSKCHLSLIDRVYLQMGDKRCWKNMCKVNSSHHNSETSAFVISVPQMGMRTWPGSFKPKASCHLLNISTSQGRLSIVPASVVPWLLNRNTLTSILVPCFEEGQPGGGMKACGCSLTSPRLARAPVLLYTLKATSPSHSFTNTSLLLGAVLVPFVCLVTGENKSFRKSSPARQEERVLSFLPAPNQTHPHPPLPEAWWLFTLLSLTKILTLAEVFPPSSVSKKCSYPPFLMKVILFTNLKFDYPVFQKILNGPHLH